MQNIYLYTNHNYYNRIIKRYTTIAEYNSALKPGPVYANINFIIRDGVRTEQVVNYDSGYGEYASGNVAPSYLVVTDEYNNILHRWWVTESKMNRGGQATLQLLRDVIADNYDLALDSPSFIEKGYVNSANSNLIFNNEQMSFNQIKTSESFIRDASKCPWYVGYLSKDLESKNISVPGVSLSGTPEYNSLEDYPYYQYNVSNPYIGDYDVFNFNFLCHNIYGTGFQQEVIYSNYQITWDQNGAREEALYIPYDFDGKEIYFGKRDGDEPIGYAQYVGTDGYGFGIRLVELRDDGYLTTTRDTPWDSEVGNRIYDKASQYRDWKNVTYGYTSATNGALTSTLLEQDGAIINVAGTPYKVTVTQDTVRKRDTIDNNTDLGQLIYRRIINPINTEFGSTFLQQDITSQIVSITYEATAYSVSLSPEEEGTSTFTIPSNRRRTLDAVYDVIAIPATPLYIGDEKTSKSLAAKVVASMVNQLPSGADAKQLYDFQLLPYCPLSDSYFNSIDNYGNLDLEKLVNTTEETRYTIVGDNVSKTIVLYLDYSSFEKFSYDSPINVSTNPLSFKIANECDTYRLCSPNYNGQFEFSAAKNNGVISWNISCSYKPYTPYVRVAPRFRRLYGGNFGDARGLICGGDFSITQTSDAWENYELANKNYQNIFDRQITNMEVNNSVQRELEAWNVATGAVTGAVGGALGGAAIGGGYGAAAGAAVGGTASLVGGMQDIRLNEKLRQEAINYARDQYGYQLQNIKALPYSLTKVGSQTSDYKYFPFVEYYTCSTEEKQALEEKIKWNGMTIMRIGTPRTYLGGNRFIKCKPIRIQGLEDESHIAEVISAELREGVYIE